MSNSPEPAPTRPRRRSRAETKEHNRQALLEAAREMMLRDGYRNTLLDDVAEQAGLTKGAIYSIFGGKDELMRALVTEIAEDLNWPDLEAVTDDGLDLEDQVDRYAQLWARGAARAVPRWESAFYSELSALTLRDEELFESNGRVMSGHRDALAHAFAGRRTQSGHPVTLRQAEALASAFAGLMQGLASRMTLNPVEFSERAFRDAARALCTMVELDDE
jgi:AcrR family transcriptional regulator